MLLFKLIPKKSYNRCGPEFGKRAKSIATILRALYGLTTSVEHFRIMHADFLCTLDFVTSRFEKDLWMQLHNSKDVYYYICTHMDDFKVVAKDPDISIERIASVCLIKEHISCKCYLGND